MNIAKIRAIFKKYYPILALIVFALTTLFIALGRIPFWDEAHQVDIARLSIVEIFKITRTIGHPILWYLIIKPFSNPNLYPYAIMFLNWIFCMGALVVLWKKSPFNLFIKTAITFSAPFLLYFAPVARCYSITILLLFILCSLYPVKNKHPYIFASLIVICANISEMAIVGCFYLGLLFLYDLYKEKNESLRNVLILFSLCAAAILFQYTGTDGPFELRSESFIARVFYFVIIPLGVSIYSILLHLFSSLMFYIFPFYSFKKSKKALFFVGGSFLTLTYIFIFKYNGSYWNHYFYYVYFIMAFWIFYKELYQNKFIKFLFCSILFMFCFRAAIFDNLVDFAYISHSKQIAKYIIENYKNSKIYMLNGWSDISPGADIYLAKENIDLYDWYNRKRTSFESLRDLYKMTDKEIDFDSFYNNLDKEGIIASGVPIKAHKFLKDTSFAQNGDDYIIITKRKIYYLKNIAKSEDLGLFMYKASDITSYGRIKIWN